MKLSDKRLKIYTGIVKGIIVNSIIIMLFACKNDISTINSLSMVDSLPLETARDIEVIYSEGGKIQAFLKSPLMKRFEKDESYTEFPEGFKIIFYDTALNQKSEITANYGISYQDKKIMEAKNNVVVINTKKNERLDTEHLIWYQAKEIIQSDVFVKITRAEEVLYGDGLTAVQDFSKYEIKNPTGEFNINPDEQ